MNRDENKIEDEVIQFLEENGFFEPKHKTYMHKRLVKKVKEDIYLSINWSVVICDVNIHFSLEDEPSYSSILVDILLSKYLLFELELILKNIDMFIMCCMTHNSSFKYLISTTKNGNSFNEDKKDGRLYLSSDRLSIVIDEHDCVIYSKIKAFEREYLY